eukprot:RCo022658
MAEAASRDLAEVRRLPCVADAQLEDLVANIRLSSGREYCVVLDENYPKGEPVLLDGGEVPRGTLAQIALWLHALEIPILDPCIVYYHPVSTAPLWELIGHRERIP